MVGARGVTRLIRVVMTNQIWDGASLRRALALGTAVVLALSGCLAGAKKAPLPTIADVELARAVWIDPWAAAADAKAPEPAVGVTVHRDVAARGYPTPLTPKAAIEAEVSAALATGWVLSQVTCGAQLSPGDKAEAVVALVVKGSGGRTTAQGSIVVSPTPGQAAPYWVGVQVVVSSHFDLDWAVPPPMSLERSCLASSAPPTKSTTSSDPLRGVLNDQARPGVTLGNLTWALDFDQASEQQAAQRLAADPVVKDLGLRINPASESQTDGFRRAAIDAPAAAAPQVGLPHWVDSARAQGWSLRYAGCWPRQGLRVAQFLKDYGNGRYAVLRLQAAPTAADQPIASWPMQARAMVATPALGVTPVAATAGPEVSVPDCLTEQAAYSDHFHAVGAPVWGPFEMYPLAAK